MQLCYFSLHQRIPYLLHNLNRRQCILQPIAFAVDDALIACGMQVGEAAAEFDFLSVNGDAAVGGLAVCAGGIGQVVVIDAVIIHKFARIRAQIDFVHKLHELYTN
jgi:hypothetical protein